MAKKIAKKPARSQAAKDREKLSAGLGALFNRELEEKIAVNPQEVVKELSNTIAMIPTKSVEVNPNQPRNYFDEKALDELAESIRVHGLIQPITVRRLSPKEFQLISGERRLRASKIAGLESVPAYIRIANDQEMLEMALIENIQREDLNAIEIALTYQRLKEECSLTDQKLSSRVGKERTTITNYLRLLSLPINIQTAIKDKQISMGHARALAGKELAANPAMQAAFFKQTIDEGLSVRALEKLVSQFKSPPAPKPQGPDLSDDYRDVEQTFREFFGVKSLAIKLKGEGKGQIVIPFRTVKELNYLLDRIEE